ncbi:unnamed protein product, partial [Rotaria magnacalcarata]
APISSCRTSVGVGVLDGCLYVVGGHDGISCLNLVEKYDPSVQQWIRVASMKTKRFDVAVAVLDGYLYAIGGSDGQCPLNTEVAGDRDDATDLSKTERFNPKMNQWSPVVAMNSRRSGVGLAVINNHLMAIGGFDGAVCLKSVELYDSESNSWRVHSEMNYRRLGGGVGVIQAQQYDSILYESNSKFNIESTSSDESENRSLSLLVDL